jgi:putative intracellular protease/amidase
VATPGGVVPYVDAMSLRPSMAGSAEIALELEQVILSAEELRRPIKLADARLDDCDAVYYPGGHGPMEDMWQDADSGRLLTAALASGKPLAIVCHAPAAMLATRRGGSSPFAGYQVTAYTNDEEDAVGLREKARWTVEDELVKMGVHFTRGEIWKPYTVVDRNLYTGQNPASAAPLAQELLKVLG